MTRARCLGLTSAEVASAVLHPSPQSSLAEAPEAQLARGGSESH
jgi:hypothetical protein